MVSKILCYCSKLNNSDQNLHERRRSTASTTKIIHKTSLSRNQNSINKVTSKLDEDEVNEKPKNVQNEKNKNKLKYSFSLNKNKSTYRSNALNNNSIKKIDDYNNEYDTFADNERFLANSNLYNNNFYPKNPSDFKKIFRMNSEIKNKKVFIN
jgi:hypothetical protein